MQVHTHRSNLYKSNNETKTSFKDFKVKPLFSSHSRVRVISSLVTVRIMVNQSVRYNYIYKHVYKLFTVAVRLVQFYIGIYTVAK